MDSLTIKLGKMGKDVNILMVADLITHYAQAFVTPLLSSQGVA